MIRYVHFGLSPVKDGNEALSAFNFYPSTHPVCPSIAPPRVRSRGKRRHGIVHSAVVQDILVHLTRASKMSLFFPC